jgi:hypothetical protein
LPARLAAGVARMFSPIGNRLKRMPDKGWRRRFDDPIQLPRGRSLVTLEDAGNYITKLPKAKHEAPEWLAAMEALILVAESDGPTSLRASASCGRSTATSSACSIPTAKSIIGGSGSWHGIGDLV